MRNDYLRTAFNMFDTDGSGSIEKEEIMQILQTEDMKQVISQEALDEYLKKVDANGDGQIDFKTIFSKLTQYGCDVWAVLEWECCIKSPEQGATEGAKIIQDLIINCTNKKFDDFAGGNTNNEDLRNILNI